MKTVILTGGRGARLFPFTQTRPKAMINVSGEFVLARTIALLREVGVVDVVVVAGYGRQKIMDHFKDGLDHGVHLAYAMQDQPLGIGNAVLAAEPRILEGENFLLVYGDIVVADNLYRSLLQSFSSFRVPSAAVCLTPSTSRFGNIFMEEDMTISRIVEKPIGGDRGNYVLAGAFVLPQSFFGLLRDAGANMLAALDALIRGYGLKASIWEGDWVDLGHPWDILTANRMIMDTWHSARIADSAVLEGDVKLTGAVQIDEEVVISSGSVIKGPCYIGPRSFVGNNVLIRPYTSVSSEGLIGFGVELKNCVLFDRVEIGRLSFLGESVVGEGVKVGPGTMTINHHLDRSTVKVDLQDGPIDTGLKKLGCFLGDQCRVGGSNTLMPGTLLCPQEVIPHHFTVPRAGGES